MNRLCPTVFMVAVLALAAPSLASAQVGGPEMRLGAGMVLDFGGELDLDGVRRDPDLDSTIGLRAHLDYDLSRYFAIGGFARLSWWEADDYYNERSMLFELGPRVTGHYDWRDFRFYVAAMPGLIISRFDDDDYVGIDNPGVGFTMSIVPGMEYWFNKDIAVYVEFLGWIGHYFDHDSDPGFGDSEFDLNQVAFNFGAVFGL